MPFLDAVRLALATIRVQKLKSFFTLLGVTIGVMFLIAVVSIVEGMGYYMQHEFIGKLMPVNTYELRRMPNMPTGEVTREEWMSWQRRPRITPRTVSMLSVSRAASGACITRSSTTPGGFTCRRSGERYGATTNWSSDWPKMLPCAVVTPTTWYGSPLSRISLPIGSRFGK